MRETSVIPRRKKGFVGVLSALLCSLVVLSAPVPASGDAPRSRFYDFSETVITGEQRVPGLEFIVGRKGPSGRCDSLDADDFRRCIGEVRDIFRYIPSNTKTSVDLAVIPFGQSATKEMWRMARPFVRGGTHKEVDSRLVLHPHPSEMGASAPPGLAKTPFYYGLTRRTASIVEKSVKHVAATLSMASVFVEPIRPLLAMLGKDESQSPLRGGAYLALVMVAREMPDPHYFADAVTVLNERYGPSGWGATVVCSPAICHAFDPFTRRPGGRVLEVGTGDSKRATELAVNDALWQSNRWTLSHNPGISGYMELRSSDRLVDKGAFSYDPFERRVRVSETKLPFDAQRRLEAWYFPFNPLQVLASVCPKAVQDGGKQRGGLPCKGWVADELVAPQPAPRVEVRLVSADPGEKLPVERIEDVFRRVFLKRQVELAWRPAIHRRPWRLDTFRVVLCAGEGTCKSQGEDALIKWAGDFEDETLETLAWRTMNRSTSVKLTGAPVIYDSLRVYLNGRRIGLTTRDGAGFVMKGNRLYLDVASPLHPESHVFVVYRKASGK